MTTSPLPVNIVTFFVDLGQRPGGFSEYEVLSCMVASARQSVPGARIIVLTDRLTAFPEGLAIDEVMRFDIPRERLMLCRMQAQRAYLASGNYDAASAFVDTDIVFNQPLDEVFATPFEVGLTYRMDGFCRIEGKVINIPINGGVMFFQPDRRGPALAYYKRALDAHLVQPEKYFAWGGNQIALLDAVGRDAFFNRESDDTVIEGTHYRFFPCERYNYTPPADAIPAPDEADERLILHFKGKRKAAMPAYVAGKWGN
jgi:hypothetical protein